MIWALCCSNHLTLIPCLPLKGGWCEVCDTKIKDLIAAISANGKDLAAATKIREDEESPLLGAVLSMGGNIHK